MSKEKVNDNWVWIACYNIVFTAGNEVNATKWNMNWVELTNCIAVVALCLHSIDACIHSRNVRWSEWSGNQWMVYGTKAMKSNHFNSWMENEMKLIDLHAEVRAVHSMKFIQWNKINEINLIELNWTEWIYRKQ